jgi:DNA-directed RNA polymerase subunit F
MQIVSSIKLKKKNGKLIAANEFNKEKYKILLQQLPEGSEVDVLFEMNSKDNTKSQLAKIHICIKAIADNNGSTPKEFKEELKEMCGLTYQDDTGNTCLKSFADCSKEDLSNVIETLIQIGNFLDINLEGSL